MKTLFIFTLSLFPFLVNSNNNVGISNGSQNKNPIVQSTSKYHVLVTKNITYAEALSHETINSYSTTIIPLKLDVYIPDNNIKNRPAYVFFHGGGFSGGSKQQSKIINLANYYTSRGWVFYSVDYRLKKHKGTVPQQWVNAVSNVPEEKARQFLSIYPAIRDAKAALRWVVSNANTYNINTNFITVGGGSAGAITAITLGISNQEDYTDEINIKQDPTLTSTNIKQDYKIRTIVDLWGSKIAMDILENIFNHQRFNSSNPPLFIAHGTEDAVVPFSNAEALKTIYQTNGVPVAYFPLEGKNHGAWEATVNNKRLEELAFDFIVAQQGLIVE